MNVKQAKALRKELIPDALLAQAKEDTGSRKSRGWLMRSTTSLEAKPKVKSTKFKGRLWWLVQESIAAGMFSIGQQMIKGGDKQQAIAKARKNTKWTGTFFDAVQVKAGFNIGRLTTASFRAIYKKAKGVLNDNHR